jgi:hypothetical protein
MKLSIIHEMTSAAVCDGTAKSLFEKPRKKKIKTESKHLPGQVGTNKVTVGYPPAKTLGKGQSGAYVAPASKPLGWKQDPTGKPQKETVHTYKGAG